MHRRAFSALLLSNAAVPWQAWPQVPAAAGESEEARLTAFFQKADEERLELGPEAMTFRGIKKRYGELGDHSRASDEKYVALSARQVAEMKKQFNRARLSPAARLSYDLFERLAAMSQAHFAWYWQSYAVTSRGTSLDNIPPMLITRHSVDTVEDAQAYISRLRAVERVAGEVSDELDERTARGLLPPNFVFGRVIPDAENQIKGMPFDSGPDQAVWADLKKKLANLDANPETKARLLAAGQAALLGEWRRGYLRYLQALKAMSEKSMGSNGVWALPGGEAYYAHAVKYHTTSDLTLDQIHQIGLAETARLRGEMAKVYRRQIKGLSTDLLFHLDQHRVDGAAGRRQDPCLAAG